MDKKRNILIREMMGLVDQAQKLRNEVDEIFDQAYAALRNANITLGMIGEIAESVPLDDGITIGYRSVMGVDIPSSSMRRNRWSSPTASMTATPSWTMLSCASSG